MKLLRNILLATLVLALLLPFAQKLIAHVATSALAACGSTGYGIHHPAVFQTTRIERSVPATVHLHAPPRALPVLIARGVHRLLVSAPSPADAVRRPGRPLLFFRHEAVLILRDEGDGLKLILPPSHGSVAPPTPVRIPVVVSKPQPV